MKEEWRTISDYPNYMVSNNGDVMSISRNTGKRHTIYPSRILKKFKNLGGYLFVVLYNNSGSKTKNVHKLLANAFIENPNNLPILNHKNGIKTDNRLDNLEWCTHKHNSIHSRDVLGKNTGENNKKSVVCVNTGIEYDSVIEAANDLKLWHQNISKVLYGKLKTTGGYKFIYRDGNN